jgi:hypothetical protein
MGTIAANVPYIVVCCLFQKRNAALFFYDNVLLTADGLLQQREQRTYE